MWRQSGRDIVWPEKACLAVEEFIFSRYYMYHNVYFHKTMRGLERLLEAMWSRAKCFFDGGKDVLLVPAIRDFLERDRASGRPITRSASVSRAKPGRLKSRAA
jgi:HD superfamily phosphohydrolase